MSQRTSSTGELAAQLDAQQALELVERGVRAAVEDRGHSHGLRRLAVLAQVVDEDAIVRWDPDPLGSQAEDLRLRLVQADLAGDDDAVEELRKGRAVVAPLTDRV